MIQDVKIDLRLLPGTDVGKLEIELLPGKDRYQSIISAISALNQHDQKFFVEIQITVMPHNLQPLIFSYPLELIARSFTKREKAVYALAIKGCSNSVIANMLSIAKETVKSHRRNIVKKVGVRKIDDIKNLLLEESGLLEKSPHGGIVIDSSTPHFSVPNGNEARIMLKDDIK